MNSIFEFTCFNLYGEMIFAIWLSMEDGTDGFLFDNEALVHFDNFEEVQEYASERKMIVNEGDIYAERDIAKTITACNAGRHEGLDDARNLWNSFIDLNRLCPQPSSGLATCDAQLADLYDRWSIMHDPEISEPELALLHSLFGEGVSLLRRLTRSTA